MLANATNPKCSLFDSVLIESLNFRIAELDTSAWAKLTSSSFFPMIGLTLIIGSFCKVYWCKD